jgi:hypothetical protein
MWSTTSEGLDSADSVAKTSHADSLNNSEKIDHTSLTFVQQIKFSAAAMRQVAAPASECDEPERTEGDSPATKGNGA